MIIFSTIFPVFFLISLGFLLDRLHRLDTKTISNLTIYLLTPSLLFTKYIGSPIPEGSFFKISVFAVGLFGIMLLLAYGASRLLKLNRVDQHSFLLSAVLINAGNMGLPVIMFAFGDKDISTAIVFLMINILINATLGVMLAAGAASSMKKSLSQVFKLPAIYAILGGILIQHYTITLPVFLVKPLSMMGEATIPVSILLLGAQLSQTPRKIQFGRTFFAVGLRLLVPPILGFVLTSLLGISGMMQKILILQTSMPTAVYAVILSTKFDTNPTFASSVVFTSTLASIATLSVLLFWLV